MTNIQRIFLAEYSPMQGCFHIDTLERCTKSNLASVLAGNPASFIPLGFFLDHDTAQAFIATVCDKLPLAEAFRKEMANG